MHVDLKLIPKNKYILALIFTIIVQVGARISRNEEICGKFDGRRIYLELDDRGFLEARNQPNTIQNSDNTTPHKQCSLELITCPSCVVTIKFTFLNISRNCGKNSVLDRCGCDYVWIYEPPFEEVSGEQFCGHYMQTNGTNLIYKSQTRSAAITFYYSDVHQHAFTLEYSAEKNRNYYEGYPQMSNMNNGSQIISSPFFPYFYPRDLNTEYVISCKATENCRIRLIFSDFQIATNSLIEFFDWNGQRMHVTTGNIFRPPILISNGPTLVIRFYANGGSNLGFKASYMFLLGEYDNSTLKPDTDCGGYVDNLGGGITMMDMIQENTKAYDCFWIIRPPESYMHLKTQVYLKVILFSKFAGSTELVIRQGMTSNEPIVEVLRYPVSHYIVSKQKEHVAPIAQGFYVSLKGIFRPESRIAIIYSAFNYKDCYSGSDFLCRNFRCIPIYLICDGFDHCGDNSDETTDCLKEPKIKMRWSHTPNFFFPKMSDRYSYLKTATIVFVACSFGLISLIFALIVLLCRMNARNRNQRHLQTHLQTINDMLDEGQMSVTEEEIVIPDDPPMYEPPPNYDYVLKMENKEKKNRKKAAKRHLDNKRPCSRCDGASSQDLEQIPTFPPPIYTSHSSVFVAKIGGEIEAILPAAYVFNRYHYSSLQNISDSFPVPIRRFRSIDLSTEIRNTPITRFKRTRFLSDSELFFNNRMIPPLRRSVTCENVFKI
ncbi:PREDICTED: uncharacterized protein LOC108557170 isoform X2 [Nicrophorus vespilloides]|uniref:Uncharacterized protein LOC108557170 isoform X2 n=1 Tax=Nicrophorus vespilloides TaxID=110193 RepID=A0ABM1M3C7_NICVS|nr:PREDICTED: uncharacterized protein LOC108557170 isoform X2 [Nicrophorus vespilloides]